MHNNLLGITLNGTSKKENREKIIKYIRNQTKNLKLKTKNYEKFLHIVSLNPENIVIAQKDKKFMKIVQSAQIKINDGAGVLVAGRILGIKGLKRLTGVELMEDLINLADKESLKVMLIGGKNNLAKSLVDCYLQKYNNLSLKGIEGIKNIQYPKKTENDAIFSIVRQYKPHLIFTAFGSPAQEKWFEANSAKLEGIVCMGVGGAFDFLSGRVSRAPIFLRRLGLEWLYRLVRQPWRWKRQLRLIEFAQLVFLQKLNLL